MIFNQPIRGSKKMQDISKRNFIILFFPFLSLILFLDSKLLSSYTSAGQSVNILVPLYFLIMYLASDIKLKQLLIIILPLSFIGELLCSPLLKLYLYKDGGIPFYIPFGHAIVYCTGYLIADSEWIKENKALIKKTLILLLFSSLGFVVFLYNDTLSLMFGFLFLAALHRKKYDVLYLIMGVLVLMVELIGTSLGCWKWQPDPLNIFHTVNPPVGAIFIYIGGDILVLKIASIFKKLRSKNNKPEIAIADPMV